MIQPRGRLTVPGLIAALLFAPALQGCSVPQWPVAGPLSSPFGLRWRGGPDLHRGLDIAADVGTPVRPILPGRVRSAATMSGYGQVIWIDHGDHTMSVYAHLSEIAVEPSQAVTKRTVIGRVGQSGQASGPHLHLEVWRWGREVDPMTVLGTR